MGSYLSIIALNVNGLNAPIKSWMDTETRSYTYFLQETHLKTRDTYRLKVKGWEKIFHANRDQKKAGVKILISDKIDFWNEGCEKRQKTLHHDQRINPWRRYNNYKYIQTQHRSTTLCKEMLRNMKREINSNTIILGDFNTPLTPMDRSTKQKISTQL